MNIDRCTHRYLLEPLMQSLHLKTMILSRFVSFHKSLVESSKFPVRFLARLQEKDMKTVLGKNLAKISDLCNTDIQDLTSSIVKRNIKYREVPDSEKWRVGLAQELISMRESVADLDGFTSDEKEELLTYVCKY